MELKALEILKENKRVMEVFVNSFDEDSKDDDEYISANEYIKQLDEAIKELEAYITNNQGIKRRLDKALETLSTINNRNCENCKYALKLHSDPNVTHSEFVCRIDSRYNNKDFYCNRWQTK